MKIEEELNEVIDNVVYLQIMGSFLPDSNFDLIKKTVTSTHEFIKTSTEEEVRAKLPELKVVLSEMTSLYLKKFPIKRELREITTEFNGFFKDGSQVYTYGLEFGWLEKQMDLSEFKAYSDIPYHYKIGLGPHRGHGSIEEDFLLKDAFSIRVKAEYFQNLLNKFTEKLKEDEQKKGKIEFDKELYQQISEIKFEVSAYSRLTIVSFYSFVEGFVNSIGYSHLCKYKDDLNTNQIEILRGFKKGRYLSLKSKMERFQNIIREDKKVKIIISDESQTPDNFKLFFDYYEQLRNSAMHYSPLKETIWMKPQEWLDKAIEFSELATKVSIIFWNSCYPNSDGPEYLGKLNYKLHLDIAQKRAQNIEKIENEKKNWQ